MQHANEALIGRARSIPEKQNRVEEEEEKRALFASGPEQWYSYFRFPAQLKSRQSLLEQRGVQDRTLTAQEWFRLQKSSRALAVRLPDQRPGTRGKRGTTQERLAGRARRDRPWRAADHLTIFEISKLMRLVVHWQPIFIRLVPGAGPTMCNPAERVTLS